MPKDYKFLYSALKLFNSHNPKDVEKNLHTLYLNFCELDILTLNSLLITTFQEHESERE